MARTNGKRILRQTTGFLFWILIGLWIAREATSTANSRSSLLAKIRAHFTQSPRVVSIGFSRPVLLEVGDPVFLDSEDSVEPVGEVSELIDEEGRIVEATFTRARRARVTLFDSRRCLLRSDARMRLVVVPEIAGSWVWKTLINERTEPLIREIWRRNGLLARREEIAERAIPIVEGLLADCRDTIAEEMRPFVDRHRAQLDALLKSAETELGSGELAALFESEIWPVLHRRLDPVLDSIGADIWERAPLWGFAWRAVYQSLPLTDDDYFERRWDEFVANEVVPVLKAHSSDFIEVSREVAKETLTRPNVGAYLRKFALALASHPEFHRLGYAFVDEVFFKNSKFRERMRDRWRSDPVQDLLGFVSAALEPTVREIGDTVLGTRSSGITPEFARVLRAQVLEKDRQRLFLDLGSDSNPPFDTDIDLPVAIEIEVPR